MTAVRRSIWPSHHHVGVYDGPSLIQRDIATHPDHFVLTSDGNLLVHFALRIKPSQGRATQCSDSGEMRARDVILLSKLLQPGKSLVSLVENHRILFRRFSRIQQLHL